jgi:hypothetical protein
MRDLHPSAPLPAIPVPDRLIKPDEMNLDQLHRVILDLPPASADGFGALSRGVLKRMVEDPLHRSCALSYLALVNNILAARLSPSALQLHLACVMIPALKKEAEVTSARDLRPICVLSPTVKIAAKFLAEKYKEKFSEVLGPRQLGTGTKGGIDIMGHTVQLVMNWAYENKIPLLAVNLDGTNAFGLCSREEAIAQVLRHAPGAFPYISSVYGCVSAAYVNGERVNISQGARQGYPMSSFVYALST